MAANKKKRGSQLPSVSSVSWSFWVLLAAALAARLFAALCRMDSHWPDEQFQTLEPAGKAVFGYGTLSWEWTTGYRSWFVPALYIPLFALMKALGAQGGSWVIFVGRAYTAVAATWVFIQIERLLRDMKLSEGSRILAIGAMAFSVPMTVWASATLADVWAMVALWGVLPTILARSDSTSPKQWFGLGVLVGLAGMVKFQLGIWIFGLGAVLAWTGVPLRLLGWAITGGLLDFLALGLLDWVTLGSPYHSVIEQLTKGTSIAKFYGVAPWWAFFPDLLKDQGPLVFSVIAALVLAVGTSGGLRTMWLKKFWSDRRAKRNALAVYLPAIVFLGALMMIDHKEERFLLPIIPALFVTLGVLADPILEYLEGALQAKRAKPLVWTPSGIAAFCAVIAVLGYRTAIASRELPLYLSSVNIAELEGAVHDDGGLSPSGSSCLLLIDHNWSWTRGQLILGAPVRIVDDKLANIAASDFAECLYAILPEEDQPGFMAAAGPDWKLLRHATTTRYVLYKRVASGSGASR